MINVQKTDKELYEQCSSCHCQNSEKDIYLISVGYSKRQTTGLRLCTDCIYELNNNIQAYIK